MHLRVLTALVAIGISMSVAPREAGRLHAQTAAPAETTPTFEVASVKANKSGEPFVRLGGTGSQFSATNVPLRLLILNAYSVQPAQLINAPKWLDERFDIVAKMPEGADISQRPLMVRALLADRFKLVIHNETREQPIYALVPARSDGKLGANMKPASADCAGVGVGRGGGFFPGGRGGAPPPGVPVPPPPSGVVGAGRGGPQGMRCGVMIGPANITAMSMTMAALAQSLSQRVGRIVVDKTNLSGNYEFELTFTPDQMPQFGGATPPPGAPPLPPIDPNGPSLFTALQEQLGLKLDSQRGPVDVLVIDSVERPTED